MCKNVCTILSNGVQLYLIRSVDEILTFVYDYPGCRISGKGVSGIQNNRVSF